VKSRIIHLTDTPAIPVPQPLLDVCHLQNEVEVEAQGGCLVIRSLNPAREGWEEAFGNMAAREDDKLILKDARRNRWDEEEWEW
jgi:antitoxin MazE